jgi:hypothetical protein
MIGKVRLIGVAEMDEGEIFKHVNMTYTLHILYLRQWYASGTLMVYFLSPAGSPEELWRIRDWTIYNSIHSRSLAHMNESYALKNGECQERVSA